MRLTRLLAAGLTALALLAAACGEATDTTTTTEPVMDMGSMMGDATATPATSIPGAALARHDAGTTVTVELESLVPDTRFIAHVHTGPCYEAGGPHYRFDPNGGSMPPNEIHLMFASGVDGVGLMTVENAAVAGPDAVSVVVHPADALDDKVVCADLDPAS